MQILQKVELEWLDTTANDEWNTIEDCKQKELTLVKTIGYLLRETDEKVVVCHSYTDDDDADCTVIPKSIIIRRRVL